MFSRYSSVFSFSSDRWKCRRSETNWTINQSTTVSWWGGGDFIPSKIRLVILLPYGRIWSNKHHICRSSGSGLIGCPEAFSCFLPTWRYLNPRGFQKFRPPKISDICCKDAFSECNKKAKISLPSHGKPPSYHPTTGQGEDSTGPAWCGLIHHVSDLRSQEGGEAYCWWFRNPKFNHRLDSMYKIPGK